MTNAEHDKDMIESIEMWLHEIEPKWVEKELAWLEELRNRLLEEDTPNDLEEAANKFAVFYDQGTCDGIAQDCFRAGAEWQKEQYHFFNKAWAENMQAELDRNYENGKQAMKEQMMREAVEGEVYLYHSYNRDATAILVDIPKENLGDKVRVIVCKKDDEK